MNDTATLGDNSNDPHALALADVQQRLDAFMTGADVWDKRAALSDEEIAALDLDDMGARVNDFIAGARKLWKDADDARKAEKQPHLDAERDVDGKWKPITTKLEAVGEIGKRLLFRIMQHKKKIREAAEKAAREAERAAQEEARRLENEARNAATVKERLAAQALADQAREAEALAASDRAANSGPTRVQSATGLANARSLKTRLVPSIVSFPQALSHYRDEPELTEAILRFAARDLREAPTQRGKKLTPAIPGIVFIEEEGV